MYLVFLIVSCLLVSASAFVPRMKSTTGSNTALNYQVRVINKNKNADNTFEAPRDQPILDTAEVEGVTSIPYSCRAGSCSACIAKLTSGEVDQSGQIFLDDDKVDQGWILTCVAMPLSDCEMEVDLESEFYDEVRELGDTL